MGCGGSCGGCFRHGLFLGFEPGAGGHGVNEVVQHVDPGQRLAQGSAVVETALDHLNFA